MIDRKHLFLLYVFSFGLSLFIVFCFSRAGCIVNNKDVLYLIVMILSPYCLPIYYMLKEKGVLNFGR